MRITVSLFLLISGAAWAADKDTCFECHSVMEGMSQVFEDDVHYKNKLSCADCHGGDSKEEDQNLSMSASRGFKVRVTRPAVADYCGRCHSDAAFMRKYAPQQPVDQVARFKTSVHNAALMAGNAKAAECADCHEVHRTRAVSDPLSSANPAHVSETCAKCHQADAEAFKKSPHARLFVTKAMAGCTTCHDAHATQRATTALLTTAKIGCAKCHSASSTGGKAAAEMARLLKGLETASGANPAAKEKLAQARAAVHSADVAAVRQLAAGR